VLSLEFRIELDYAEAYYNMGNAYTDLGRYTDAIAAHTKAIALEPTAETADHAREVIRDLREW